MKTTGGHRGGTLMGILIGLVIGVLISFGIVWFMNKTPLPFRDKGLRADRPVNGGNGEPAATPAPLPGKPGDKVGERGGDKTRFEFYKILPGSEEASPAPKPAETKPAETKPADSKGKETKAATEPLYLQVGAFQKPADADNLKAKLALMGVDATVHEVEVADKGKMYRVRTGPFASVDEMNRARKALSDNGVQTATVKGN